ncbi:MAG: helix-turn-helix transcriptional regulator [Roseburia sp.]|nr:helix-turn-helix transcriptional regulator [Roseburia sp.]
MLKEFLNQKKISIYKLSQTSGVPYSTLNDIVNGKIDISNCKAGSLKRIADSLEISMDELYDICSTTQYIISEKYGIAGKITVKDKKYDLSFSYNGSEVTFTLYSVNAISTRYIKEISEWRIDEYIENERIREGLNGIHYYAQR